MAFVCDVCDQSYSEKTNLNRHKRNQHPWTCSCCQQTFYRHDNYKLHERMCVFKKTGKRISSEQQQGAGAKKRHTNVSRVDSALQGALVDYSVNLQDDSSEPKQHIRSVE